MDGFGVVSNENKHLENTSSLICMGLGFRVPRFRAFESLNPEY